MFPTRQHGMTLIEVMIAVTLMAIVTVLAASGLRFAIKSWSAIALDMNGAPELSQTEAFLRRQLGQTKRMMFNTEAGSQVPFTGEQNHLGFVSRLRGGTAGAGLYRLDLTTNNDGELVLHYTIWPGGKWSFVDGENSGIGDNSVILLNNLESARFEYFGSTTHDNPAWVSKWSSLARLPRLVRFQIKFKGLRATMNIVIPLHVLDEGM